MIDGELRRVVLGGKRHAKEQREHAHDGRGQVENLPGHISSLNSVHRSLDLAAGFSGQERAG
jgi:hypothetical protein